MHAPGLQQQFAPRANTAIHIGMKWGVAMLDRVGAPVKKFADSTGPLAIG